MGDDSSVEGPQVKSEYDQSDPDTDDEDNGKTKAKLAFIRNPFSRKEDFAIIKYLLENKRYALTGGNIVWKDAVNDKICPGRSFWSLKERFKKRIINNLESYKLNDEQKRKLMKEDHDEENDKKMKLAVLREKCEQKEYTKKEDIALIKFFVANDEDFTNNGHKLWKLAEELKICPGRSFWSMRERFLKFIVPNIKSYGCDEADKKKVKAAALERYGQISEIRGNYIIEEDLALIKYISEGNRFLHANGLQVWKQAEEKEICPGRSFWSMKERFKKIILPNLIRYNLDEERKEKLHFLVHATSADLMLKRKELKRKEALQGLKKYLNNSNDSKGTLSDSSPNLRKNGRFHYPPIEHQRTLESPMGRVSEISIIDKTSSKKSRNMNRDQPQPCCSKNLSPIKTSKITEERKAANEIPTKANDKSPKKISKSDKNLANDLEETPEVIVKDRVTTRLQDLSPNKNSVKRKVVNDSPKKANENSPKKKAKEDKTPFESVDLSNKREEGSDGADNVNPRSRKIVPFFEYMKMDEKNLKIVTSTPKKSPSGKVLNNKPKQDSKNIKISKSKMSKKKKNVDLDSFMGALKKLKSVNSATTF